MVFETYSNEDTGRLESDASFPALDSLRPPPREVMTRETQPSGIASVTFRTSISPTKARLLEVVIPARLAGNPVESIVMPYQIRTIDKARLLEPLGRVADAAVRRAIEDRIIEHLGIAFDDPAGDDE